MQLDEAFLAGESPSAFRILTVEMIWGWGIKNILLTCTSDRKGKIK